MIDHIGFPVSDYARAKAFYERALAPLGYALIMEANAERGGQRTRLGQGDDPVYVKVRCFAPYPFPAADITAMDRIRVIAEAMDAHRKQLCDEYPDLSLTSIYNVLARFSDDRRRPNTRVASRQHEKSLSPAEDTPSFPGCIHVQT